MSTWKKNLPAEVLVSMPSVRLLNSTPLAFNCSTSSTNQAFDGSPETVVGIQSYCHFATSDVARSQKLMSNPYKATNALMAWLNCSVLLKLRLHHAALHLAAGGSQSV